MVHHNACPNLDLRYLDSCSDKVRCSIRHDAHSMRIGIVLKLRKAFSEVGRRELYDPLATEGDPTNLTLVHEYINFKHLEQGESGVLPNSAPKISYTKMILLLENLKMDIRSRRGIIKLRMAF